MKRLLAVLLVVLTVFSSGCVDEAIGTIESIACENIDPATVNSEWDRDHCYKDAALRTKNSKLCDEIGYSPPKTKCYMEIAEKTGEGSLCEKLQNSPSGGDYSRIECLQRVAKSTGDTKYCDSMGNAAYGTFTATYDAYNCYKSLGRNMPIAKMMAIDSGRFKDDADVFYALITGRPPAEEVRKDRRLIDIALRAEEYNVEYQGATETGTAPSGIALKDGDVIYFSTAKEVAYANEATFLAFVKDGKIYMPSWELEAGVDGPYELKDFFDGQTHKYGSGGFMGLSKSYQVYRKG